MSSGGSQKTSKTNSSKNSASNQTNAIAKWNQCSYCGLIIVKHFNDDHICDQNKKANEHLNSLIEMQQPFLSSNLSYLKCIEHSKGNF
jgi:hypothetical protein